MIVAHEWYNEVVKSNAGGDIRDYEADAEDAFVEGEKIYE